MSSKDARARPHLMKTPFSGKCEESKITGPSGPETRLLHLRTRDGGRMFEMSAV